MNVLLTTDLTVMAVNAVILVIVMCTHRGRAKVIGWLGDILAGLKAGFGFPVLRYLLIEWPLRAITGRWPADQQKITELERSELGTGEPERAPAVFADTELRDMIAGRMDCGRDAYGGAVAYWTEEAAAPAISSRLASGFDPVPVLRVFGIPGPELGRSVPGKGCYCYCSAVHPGEDVCTGATSPVISFTPPMYGPPGVPVCEPCELSSYRARLKRMG